MKAIILAGGLGTRMSEETDSIPKPMVLIDHRPILWHLMNLFAVQGVNEFVLALGYKGDKIKRWVMDLHDLSGDIHISLLNGKKETSVISKEFDWDISAIDTGQSTETGGRIKRCLLEISDNEVIVTYGDGLGNINIAKLLEFHKSHEKMVTVTAVRPPARFGNLELDTHQRVTSFGEKNQMETGWINGGFFVLNRDVLDFIDGDLTSFEFDVLPMIAKAGELMAFKHHGFWKPMDTLREKNEFSQLALQSEPPWLANIL